VRVLTSTHRGHEAPRNEWRVYRTLELIPSLWQPRFISRPLLASRRFRVESRNARVLVGLIEETRPEAVVLWNGRNLGEALIRRAQGATVPVAFYLADQWLAGSFRGNSTGGLGLSASARQHALHITGVPKGPIRFEHMIFCSQALMRGYRRAGIDVTDGRVIRLGVSPNIFSPQRPRLIERSVDSRSILFVGRICPEKGVTTLVRALRRLRSMTGLGSTTLTICGPFQDDVYHRNLVDLIARLGLRQAVQFLAPRPRLQLPALYYSHDVLAFPSEWDEPFSLTLLEAMSTGLPVVSSIRGGSAEIVRDGYNASVFEAGNADDLAIKLAWTLCHPSEAAEMALSASDNARTQYSLEAFVDGVEDYLSKLTA
jgi:glycogen(starch) synthase